MLLFCLVARAVSFSVEASEITQCKLDTLGEFIKANEIVEHTEKHCQEQFSVRIKQSGK